MSKIWGPVQTDFPVSDDLFMRLMGAWKLMSSVGLVRKPVVHNLNLAVILAFISWVEPTLLVVATELVPSPVRRGKVGIGVAFGV